MADLVTNGLQAKGVQIQDAVVVILGIAYLENTDDTRNTPAAVLSAALQSRGASVRLHDPYVKDWEFTKHKVMTEIMKAAYGADCLALVTKHDEYFSLNLDAIKGVMKTPVLVDGRNIFDTKTVIDKGFEYRCVGKKGVQKS
jgi:UDP-N-acetyl-D-mannosaminuronic acid dehydrogenase